MNNFIDDATTQDISQNKMQSDETYQQFQQIFELPQIQNLYIETPGKPSQDYLKLNQEPSDQLVQERDGNGQCIEYLFLTPQPTSTEKEFFNQEMDEFFTSVLQIDDIEYQLPKSSEIFEKILLSLLNGQQPNDQEIQQLNDIELNILESISQKKQLNNEPKNQPNNKRIEEKQKFFFKKAFKRIERNFASLKIKSNNIKKNKKKQKPQNSMEFYQYYFENVAKQHGIKMENFLHPQKQHIGESLKRQEQKQPKRGLKSMNQTYLSLILQSQPFFQEIKYYLQNEFFNECSKDRKQKVNKFLQKCSQVSLKAVQEYGQLSVKDPQFQHLGLYVKRKLCDYILENPKCKIPWTINEINEVILYAELLLDENQKLNLNK